MKCLYNGHIAPELPVYDQGEFPYALIVSANADNTALILMLCVNRPYYGTNPEDSTKTGVYNTGRMKVYTCTDTDEAWSFSMETENPLTSNDDDPGGGVIWTREDILKTGELVWMEGSEPVPVGVSESWLRSFKTGLALGLTGAPLPFPQKEPVAYLYNGVRLPKLPEWDKVKYPYAVLQGMSGSYRLNVSSLPIYAIKQGEKTYITVSQDAEGHNYQIATGSEYWEGGMFGGVSPIVSLPVFWANYDVKYEDGKPYLTASEPVPVYE